MDSQKCSHTYSHPMLLIFTGTGEPPNDPRALRRSPASFWETGCSKGRNMVVAT